MSVKYEFTVLDWVKKKNNDNITIRLVTQGFIEIVINGDFYAVDSIIDVISVIDYVRSKNKPINWALNTETIHNNFFEKYFINHDSVCFKFYKYYSDYDLPMDHCSDILKLIQGKVFSNITLNLRCCNKQILVISDNFIQLLENIEYLTKSNVICIFTIY